MRPGITASLPLSTDIYSHIKEQSLPKVYLIFRQNTTDDKNKVGGRLLGISRLKTEKERQNEIDRLLPKD